MTERPTSEPLINVQETTLQATAIAQETIANFRTNQDFMVIQETIEPDRNYVYIFRKQPVGEPILFQGFTFNEKNELTQAAVNGRNQGIVIHSDEVLLTADDSFTDQPKGLQINCQISGESQELKESVQLAHPHKTLVVESKAAKWLGRVGFILSGVKLNDAVELPTQDVQKVVPGGRFISLNQLLRLAIDPTRSGQEVQPLLEDYDYPEKSRLTWEESFCALPDKEKKNSWLVLNAFNSREARALKVEINFDQVTISQSGQSYQLGFYYWVDGLQFPGGIDTTEHPSEPMNFSRQMIAQILEDYRERNL
jgi:hypothetical protein